MKHNIKCLKGLQKYRLQQKALKKITLFFIKVTLLYLITSNKGNLTTSLYIFLTENFSIHLLE